METGAEVGVTQAGARGHRSCRRREDPPWSPQRTPGPAGPWTSDFSLQGRERAGSHCFKSPVCGPLLQQPQDAGPGGSREHPGSVRQRVGAWRWARVKLEGPPCHAGAATRDCSSRGCPCHLPTSSGGASTRAGGQSTLCASLGDGEGAQGSPRAAHPLGGAGVGGYLLLRHDLKVWTAAFPE